MLAWQRDFLLGPPCFILYGEGAVLCPLLLQAALPAGLAEPGLRFICGERHPALAVSDSSFHAHSSLPQSKSCLFLYN